MTGVLLLAGCDRGRGGDSGPEPKPALRGTTPSKCEMSYTAQVEGKGTWEVKLTMFPPATLDQTTGKMNTFIPAWQWRRLVGQPGGHVGVRTAWGE